MPDLAGKRVAILVEQEFEDRELAGPLEALRGAGATVVLIGPTAGSQFTGKRGEVVVTSDIAAGSARIADFDALVIPGGHAPDQMRMRHALVDLARLVVPGGRAQDKMARRHEMLVGARDGGAAEKPVAAICHGPQLLISAN